jgi:AcrR family transcriptional regulator
MTTKERIIYESLNLFSKKGFDAISVRDIAGAVGIKASSLYNHFSNKQDIFDTIIERYSDHIFNFYNRIKIYEILDESSFNKINLFHESFFNKSIIIFRFYLEDEYIVKFRKLLTIEQFNNSKLSNLYNKIFIDDILDFQTKVFETLMNANILVKNDPYTLALEFYSPVFLLFYKLKNVTDKERVSLKNHIYTFRDAYTMKG